MTTLATARHQFLMQLRRKAVWITFGLITLVTVTLMAKTPWTIETATPVAEVMAEWSVGLNLFYPVAFGALLADRLPRARRLNVEELATATPASPGTRLLATSLGATAATVLPILIVWAGGTVAAAIRFDDVGTVWLGAAAFVAINLPGLLFVAAFSLVCPLLMPVSIYQFLFIGYYMWGNWIGPSWGIPTLSGTWLTPAGGLCGIGAVRLQPDPRRPGRSVGGPGQHQLAACDRRRRPGCRRLVAYPAHTNLGVQSSPDDRQLSKEHRKWTSVFAT